MYIALGLGTQPISCQGPIGGVLPLLGRWIAGNLNPPMGICEWVGGRGPITYPFRSLEVRVGGGGAEYIGNGKKELGWWDKGWVYWWEGGWIDWKRGVEGWR
jgi:hypothetical protein